jgi:uncharacterized protein (TIGR02246 family)
MATEQADAHAALRGLDEAFVRDANRKDAAALVAGFYAEDAVLLPPNAPMLTGVDAIREFWQTVLDAGVADVTLETTRVGASGDLAYGIGRYTLTAPLAGGGRAEDGGKYLVVFRRQADGTWKAIADMFGSNRPPAG